MIRKWLQMIFGREKSEAVKWDNSPPLPPRCEIKPPLEHEPRTLERGVELKKSVPKRPKPNTGTHRKG